jgi:iron complex transport system ATP-binding protein
MSVVIEGLCVRLDRFTLGEISVRIPAGEVTAVLGPNGCGKSTLLRTAAGVQAPRSGVVRLAGESVHGLVAAERPARIAFVAQRPAVPVGMQVEASVRLGRLRLPRHDAVVTEAMRQVGVLELAHARLDTLSEGQRHRAAVARALAQRNPLLRMVAVDEPTASLDPGWCGELAVRLRGLASEGLAVMAATHDLAFAAACCSHAVLLRSGRLVSAGPFEAVVTPESMAELFAQPFERLSSPDGRTVVAPRWR